MKAYGTTSSVTSEPVRFKREMTRHPGKPNRCPVRSEYKFDGQGGYAPDSGKIPLSAIPGTIVVVTLLGLLFFVGAGVF